MTDSAASQPPHKLKFIPTAATFKLHEQLGAGTVGLVYRAESPDLDHPVAIKMLHPAISHDNVVVDRFQREITIMERLNHPHIVRVFGGGFMEGQYFYAMQLLSTGTLKERIQEHGPLPWAQAAAYASQIASALQHAHNHGIIHRDLKSSNLFFDDEGRIVLGDFGIARDTHEADISADGITVGTYAYMSPEQICADKKISGKADLYSLGCVMYEMLSGKPPFQGANFAQVWDQHLNTAPTSLREKDIVCPEWLNQLIMELLEKDTEQRPFNARAVQGLIRDHLEEEFGSDLAVLTQPLRPVKEDEQDVDNLRVRICVGIALAIGAAVAAVLLNR